MKHRLYLPDLTQTGKSTQAGTSHELEGENAHYLNRVLRLRVGAEIGLFDGMGREWRARLETSSAKQCSACLLELSREETAPTPLIVVQSWLKGAAMDNVVQKATELGATAIWLLQAERCNLKLDRRRLDNKLAHLNRVSISAAQQCETLWLPTLEQYDDLASVLTSLTGYRTILLAPNEPTIQTGGEPESSALLVGPEGGWSEKERLLAEQTDGVMAAGLGELTLRAETAPLAALAAIRHSWGWRR